ncbi:MAG: hypothetical protein LBB09_02830 [Rickettsiales bacterium]|jgi:hypothetical protein|nr:hypothetical protein [Rickettsiales bacterium]
MNFELIVFKYADIFFTVISGALFVAFVFLTTHINSKFFIFFISSFANIFCYSVIIADQYNFSYIVLLAIIFMLIVIFYYILVDIDEKLLPVEFVNRTTLRYIVIIASFLISFLFISIAFTSLIRRKDALHYNDFSTVLANQREKVESGSGKNITLEKKTVVDGQEKNIIYEKTFRSKRTIFFKYFNILIFIYVIFLNISYFIYKRN